VVVVSISHDPICCKPCKSEVCDVIIRITVVFSRYNRDTPLHCAVEKGRDDVVKFLVEKGANVNDEIRVS